MNIRRIVAAVAASALLVALAVVFGTGEALTFSSDNYYIFPLAGGQIDVDALVASAQLEGFAVVQHDGLSVIAYDGSALATEPIPTLLGRSQLLVVDGDRFLMRIAGESSTVAIRPSAAGMELVYSPIEAQSLDDVFGALVELERLGAISADVDFEYSEFAKGALKGPQTPSGARIESDLYWLTVAEDWNAFAATKAMSVTGLRVTVVAELLPDSELPAAYSAFVASEAGSLVELLLPIDLLMPLAFEGSVGLIRLPYEPAIP